MSYFIQKFIDEWQEKEEYPFHMSFKRKINKDTYKLYADFSAGMCVHSNEKGTTYALLEYTDKWNIVYVGNKIGYFNEVKNLLAKIQKDDY